jgi:hypothetical protein
MHTVTNPSTARYLASQALLDGGFTSEQVGRAMLALEAVDPEPDTELEIEAYEPTEAEWQEYELYLDRLEAERGCDAWTIQPVR